MPQTVNINIRDNFYQAIEQYNNMISSPIPIHSRRKRACYLSKEEKTGMLYNMIRSNMSIRENRFYQLSVTHLSCEFNENGTLRSMRVNKSRQHDDFMYTESEAHHNIRGITELANTKRELYPTAIMNEISDIVNSIK